jgi:hypothetical protein
VTITRRLKAGIPAPRTCILSNRIRLSNREM